MKVQSRMLPPFLVFQDELSSASFLGRPPTSPSPLGGSSTAAENYFFGGCGGGWGGEVGEAGSGEGVRGGGVCLPGCHGISGDE